MTPQDSIENSAAGCSLPPQINGEVLGEIEIFIPAIEAINDVTFPSETQIRARWWGERHQMGALLQPMNIRDRTAAVNLKDVENTLFTPMNRILFPLVAEKDVMATYCKDMVRPLMNDRTTKSIDMYLFW